MAKHDDDDLIDPIKFTIGCFKFMFWLVKTLFGLVKMLYSGLTSPDYFVRIVTIIFILFIVLSIGVYFQMQNLDALPFCLKVLVTACTRSFIRLPGRTGSGICKVFSRALSCNNALDSSTLGG